MEISSILAIMALILVIWIPALLTLLFIVSIPLFAFKMFRVGIRTYSVLGEDWKDHIDLLKENKHFWESQIEIGEADEEE